MLKALPPITFSCDELSIHNFISAEVNKILLLLFKLLADHFCPEMVVNKSYKKIVKVYSLCIMKTLTVQQGSSSQPFSNDKILI